RLGACIGDLVYQSRSASGRHAGPHPLAKRTNERQSRLHCGKLVMAIDTHTAAKQPADNRELEVEPGRGFGGGVIVVAGDETTFLAWPDHVAQVTAGEVAAEPKYRTVVDQPQGAFDLAADSLVLVVEVHYGAARRNRLAALGAGGKRAAHVEVEDCASDQPCAQSEQRRSPVECHLLAALRFRIDAAIDRTE